MSVAIIPPTLRRRRLVLWTLSGILVISAGIVWSFHRSRYLALDSLRENGVGFCVTFPGGVLRDGNDIEFRRRPSISLKGMPGAVVRFFAPFGHVDYVDFQWRPTTDCDLCDLAPLTEVTTIHCLNAIHVTDRSCRVLERFQNLRFLEMYGSQITDQGLARLGKIGGLEELLLRGSIEGCDGMELNSAFTGIGFAEWPVDHPLHSLDVQCTALNLDGFNALSRLSNLRFLNVSDCNTLLSSEMMTIPVFPALEEVRGTACFGNEFYAVQPKLKGNH